MKSITISENKEGVLLEIDVQSSENHPAVSDIVMELKSFNVTEYNMKEIEQIVNFGELKSSNIIEGKMEVIPEDEIGVVEIKDNDMVCTIEFIAAKNGGAAITEADIRSILKKSGVKKGILEDTVKIGKEKDYNVPYVIAKGEEVVDGKDGYIEYHFDIAKKKLAPVVGEDGSADYQNIDLYVSANKDQKLFTIHPPVKGTDGVTVKGKVTKSKKGKKVSKIPAGKNVKLSEDKTFAYALESGQIENKGNKVNIVPILEIRKDIDNSTGNINFNGSVKVGGSVKGGFSLKAKGTIEIMGVVEGANIFASGDCIIAGGIIGGGKAVVTSLGDITAKFIDSAKIASGGIVRANSIMHSDVSADKSILVEGKKGLLVGGKISAVYEVNAGTIGSPMGTSTKITVGALPAMLDKYKHLIVEYEKVAKEIDKHDKGIKLIRRLGENIDSSKKNLLASALYHNTKLKKEKKEIAIQLKEIIPILESGKGKVIVSQVIHPGANIVIGNAGMKNRDQKERLRFINKDGKIVSIPL